MIITLQSLAVVMGVNMVLHPSWSSFISFVVPLLILWREEHQLMAMDKHDHREVDRSHPSQFNEDDPEWGGE